MRYRHSVVSDRHARSGAPVDPGEHGRPVEHAAAAVYDEVVFGEVLWEVGPATVCNFDALGDLVVQKRRDLDAADIVADPVVGAALRNENSRAVAKRV